ncbi:hypothetical protein UA08_04147 [Talaromyces atroroseus]|uniref:Uncharacterized protein n=1 Tax=Talaromyces atroroseus TaxID=1441469 RepID=A0A1Q5Q8V4_TALAT|nr:hypothetical protein UA08_04147 [Talaromyces atroroseus]OKL60502.1 hypothetical protein UA08_04147 [Talaromyces atroroseus]
MANAEQPNALMSDNDRERSSSPQGSFEHVVYENSDSDSVTLSGSDQAQQAQTHDGKRDFKYDEAAEVMSDTETLPEYKPETSHYETAALLTKGAYHDQDAAEQADEGGSKCSRRGCFGRRRCCRRRGRRASMKCDKKRRVRRRIAFFIKTFLLLGLFSFLMVKMCLRHKRGEHFSDFEDFSTPRQIIRNYYSHDISGQFPLFDLLALKTTSGNINVVIAPQPAGPEYPDEPARLLLKTDSGSISVAFVHKSVLYLVTYDNGDIERLDTLPADFENLENVGVASIMRTETQIPYRPYEVVISTRSGSINGRIIFSSSVYLETHSGDISASLLPVVPLGDDAVDAITDGTSIVTKTLSGTQAIALGEPLFTNSSEEEKASYNITEDVFSSYSATSSHISESGNLQISYPRSWAGNLTALYNWGPVALGGRGLEITESNHRYTKGFKRPNDDEDKAHEWWGSRGDMEVLLKTDSGAVSFHV